MLRSKTARTADTSRHVGRSRVGRAAAFGTVAALAAVVGGFAWSRPTSATEALHYSQTGSLSYGAALPATSVYGAGGLRPGEPIYTSVVKELRLRFSYEFGAAAPAALTGKTRLVATIDNGQGIARSFLLQRATTFKGTQADATGILSMRELRIAAGAFNRAAGGAGTDDTVTISPVVKVRGRLGPASVATTFAPQWSFAYSGSALVPNTSSSGATGSTATGQAGAGSFTSSSPGALDLPATHAATLWLNGLTVGDARIGALALFVLALLAAGLASRRLIGDATSSDEAVRIATVHRSTLIDVETLPERGALVVDVASFAGLTQVARRVECPVLHSSGAAHTYAVVDNGTLYRYRTAGPEITMAPFNGGGNGNGAAHAQLAMGDHR